MGYMYCTYVVLRVDVVARLSHGRLDRLHVARSHILKHRFHADVTHSLHNTNDMLTHHLLNPLMDTLTL